MKFEPWFILVPPAAVILTGLGLVPLALALVGLAIYRSVDPSEHVNMVRQRRRWKAPTGRPYSTRPPTA